MHCSRPFRETKSVRFQLFSKKQRETERGRIVARAVLRVTKKKCVERLRESFSDSHCY
jgi:hypothetical protein